MEKLGVNEYTKKAAVTLFILGALFLSGCQVQLLDTVKQIVEFANRSDKTAPEVVFTSPQHLDLDWPRNRAITVTFNEDMDPATVTSSSFTVWDGTRNVSGTVVFHEATRMAIFDPDADWSHINYTATVSIGTKDLAGNGLKTGYSWLFGGSTGADGTAPTVMQTVPADLETLVGINSSIGAYFNEPLDPTSIDGTKFTLTYNAPPPGTGVSGVVTYVDAGHVMVFTPGSNLALLKIHTATIFAGVRDLAGNQLAANEIWSFTTANAGDTTPPIIVLPTDPNDGNIDVPVNSSINITFNEPMNPSTINNSTILLSRSGTPVVGIVNYNYATKTASFVPSAPLAYLEVYTARVTTAVEDVSGNPLAAEHAWSFVTVANDTNTASVTTTITDFGNGSGGGELQATIHFADQSNIEINRLTEYHFLVEESVQGGLFNPVNSWRVSPGAVFQKKSVAILFDDSYSMYWFEPDYKQAVMSFLGSLGPGDSAEIIHFININPGVDNISVYPPGGPTADKSSLLSYVGARTCSPMNNYTQLWDGIGKGMTDLAAQPFDVLRGLKAVLAFTDAYVSNTYSFAWDYNNCLTFSQSNNIPVYVIAFADANSNFPYLNLGGFTSGFVKQTANPVQVQSFYLSAVSAMNGMLRNVGVYNHSWTTTGTVGQTVTVRVTVNYVTTGGSFTDTATSSYTLP